MKRTQKILAFTLSAVFVAASLSACQPTPEKPIVNAGDDTELNDKIEATAIPTPEATEENLASVNNFPEAYKDSFACVDDDVKFDIDAVVSVPDVKAAPVLEIAPTCISAEMVKKFTEKMHPDVTFYDQKEIYTKADIQECIDELEKKLAKPYEEFIQYYVEQGDSRENAAIYYEQCKYELEEYKRRLPDAPDTVDIPPSEFEYHDLWYYYYRLPSMDFDDVYHDLPPEEDDGRRFIMVNGKTDNNNEIRISVTSRFEGDIMSEFSYYCHPVGAEPGDSFYNYPMYYSENDIRAKCEEVLDAMGLKDVMVLSKLYYGEMGSNNASEKPPKNNKPCILYTAEYRRGYNGLKVNDVDVDNEYAFVNENETITINIQHDMVTSVEYENPYEITTVENENVELVPFDEVCAAFKRQAAVEYTKSYLAGGYSDPDADYENVAGGAVQIKGINFTMVRIPIRNGGYRYIPAWQFEGSYDVFYKDGETEHNGETIQYVFMTINAVDNTRIAGIQ